MPRKFASNRRDVPAFQGCDENCTAEGGYPALCEMYPDTHHEGCPRQAAASVPPEPPTLSDETRVPASPRAVDAAIEKAQAELSALCGGKRFLMSIPARPDAD